MIKRMSDPEKKMYQKLEALTNEDFQNRAQTGGYPESNIADSISLLKGSGYASLHVEFKNTTEAKAKSWVIRYLKKNGLVADEMATYQDGDYQDDWVAVTATFWNKTLLAL